MSAELDCGSLYISYLNDGIKMGFCDAMIETIHEEKNFYFRINVNINLLA